MAISNEEIAAAFNQLADLLEIEGHNPYRVRAYRRAARIIHHLSANLADMVEAEIDLTTIPKIGKGIAASIKTLIETNQLPLLNYISAKTPATLNELTQISGLGPKRIQLLHQKLNIRTKQELKLAIEKDQLTQLKGFNKKLIEKIIRNLNQPKVYNRQFKLYHIIPVLVPLDLYLKASSLFTKVECASSYRRRKEVIHSIKIIMATDEIISAKDYVRVYPGIKVILAETEFTLTVLLHIGIQIQFHFVAEKKFASTLLFYTGSQNHFKALQELATQKKLHLDENGLHKAGHSLSLHSEAEIYHKLNLAYILPELREARGEIMAAANNQLPKLIELKDIRGDLHTHTNETDGVESLEAMVNEAAKHGYEYVAVTDHSKRLTITNGLNEERLLAQIKLIDHLNAKLKNITILKACEVDILEDGKLDISDDVLKELDIRVCSVHYKFNLSIEEQTERIIRAMDNRYFNILGHPTGRLINKREPYAIDMQRIIQAAKERGCFLELNAQPYRLDLNDIYCKAAKEHGVKIAISSDAHSLRGFSFMQLGIYQARRGWLAADDVINTRTLIQLKKLLKR